MVVTDLMKIEVSNTFLVAVVHRDLEGSYIHQRLEAVDYTYLHHTEKEEDLLTSHNFLVAVVADKSCIVEVAVFPLNLFFYDLHFNYSVVLLETFFEYMKYPFLS